MWDTAAREAEERAGRSGGPVVYNYNAESYEVFNTDGTEVTVEQAKKDAFNVIIYDGISYLIPICVTIYDGSVVFAVKQTWEYEIEVVSGVLPK